MTFPQAHQYVTIIGDAYGATERWQFGLRLTSGGVSNQATADALKPIVLKWWLGTAAPYTVSAQFRPSTTHRLTEIKCANIDVDGKYPPTLPSASAFFVPGQASSFTQPAGQIAQATIAATLFTALPRGLASKGRIYLPPSGWMLPGTDGLLPVPNAQAVADSVRILISEINADSVIGNVAIFSRGRGVPSPPVLGKKPKYTYPNAGAMNVVTGVRVGKVVDTQRRRRRSLVESPVTSIGPV